MRQVAVALALFSSACGGALPAAQAPPPPPPAASAEPPAAALGPTPTATAKGIPKPPEHCSTWASRAVGGGAACAETSAALEALAKALAATEPAARDAALANLESCTGLPVGVLRALRAELGPPECGDAMIEPLLAAPPAGLRADVRDALAGLTLAAKARRLVRDPPTLAPPHDKQRVQAFVAGELAGWIRDQAGAVYDVGVQGASLEGYGKGVVAIETGLADLRFIEVVRGVPAPTEFTKDSELAEAYFSSLDQSLEPRKARGRDAALVGLEKLADVGALTDPRVQRARQLLSQLYAGRRIDALDRLLLPPLPAAAPRSVEERLAANLPSFYLPLVLPGADYTDPGLLRAALERGLPTPARTQLSKHEVVSPLYARALLDLGRRYWRARDFAEAAKAARAVKKPAADTPLVRALGEALASGPVNAVQMMLKGPHLPKGFGEVAGLDGLARGAGERAGQAAFDAALLLEVARPPGADVAYFRGVAERYRRAERLLGGAEKSRAAEAASAAEETAKAVEPKS